MSARNLRAVLLLTSSFSLSITLQQRVESQLDSRIKLCVSSPSLSHSFYSLLFRQTSKRGGGKGKSMRSMPPVWLSENVSLSRVSWLSLSFTLILLFHTHFSNSSVLNNPSHLFHSSVLPLSLSPSSTFPFRNKPVSFLSFSLCECLTLTGSSHLRQIYILIYNHKPFYALRISPLVRVIVAHVLRQMLATSVYPETLIDVQVHKSSQVPEVARGGRLAFTHLSSAASTQFNPRFFTSSIKKINIQL